jgi:hypothetical protein
LPDPHTHPQGLKPYEAAHKQLAEWRDELADSVQGALAGLLLGLGADALTAARIKVRGSRGRGRGRACTAFCNRGGGQRDAGVQGCGGCLVSG